MQILFVLFFAQMTNGQESSLTMNHADLKIDGLILKLNKTVVVKHFGEPVRIFEPKYECGFLSEAEQGQKYYSLQYIFLTFTGNENGDYILEKIEINPDLKNRITYKGKELSSKTTKQEFEIMMGMKIDDTKLIYFKNCDDGMIFIFKNGLLNKIEYWSPC